MTNFAAYIYDATYALVKGIVAYNELLNDGGPLPLHISGLALKEVMISQNLTFNGVSGRVAFSSGRPFMANYGRGDRTVGVRYAVVNFNSENGRLGRYHPRLHVIVSVSVSTHVIVSVSVCMLVIVGMFLFCFKLTWQFRPHMTSMHSVFRFPRWVPFEEDRHLAQRRRVPDLRRRYAAG